MALPDSLIAEFDQMVKKYPERRSALIPAIHRCQEELDGWITPDTMEALAEYFGIEAVDVWGVVSFYPMFRTTKPGKHVVSVCHNVACDLRGAEDIIKRVCEVTGAEVGSTSADGKFTVERVECQGACTNAPMFDLDGVYHEDLDDEKVAKILGGLK